MKVDCDGICIIVGFKGFFKECDKKAEISNLEYM